MQYNAIKEIVNSINVQESSNIIWIVTVILVISLFKHFYNRLYKNKDVEQMNLQDCLVTYTKVLKVVKQYELKEVEYKDLLITIYDILPICTYELKKQIMLIEGPGEILEDVCNQIKKNFDDLKLNSYQYISKYSVSIIDRIGYVIGYSGIKTLVYSCIMTCLSVFFIVLVLVLISAFVIMGATDRVLIFFSSISLFFYIMLVIGYIEMVIKKMLICNKWNYSAIIILMLIPIGVIYIICRVSIIIFNLSTVAAIVLFMYNLIKSNRIVEPLSTSSNNASS